MNLHDKIMGSMGLANRVLRYHTWPVLHKQSIGEHSNRMITMFVEIFGMPRPYVLHYIAVHDYGEFYAGDIPFTAKRDNATLKQASNHAERTGLKKFKMKAIKLTREEWLQVKCCDILEMYEFASYELMMGNHFAAPIIDNVERAVREVTNGHPKIAAITHKWLTEKQKEFSSE